ncbi:uncharacterized protein LOC124690845 [Lolium rigidum]|uniref:uncharacterized protein LOC124690844 n=1 Tax=Lolium rigidum TaxID=89674 RepID=UPI001F5C3C82|nr:uncharacterized protein LOC124690844 [Lolium rigidum]XP_047080129.1 uncharacterized protein LOC124690845 [Lolium rigidum]
MGDLQRTGAAPRRRAVQFRIPRRPRPVLATGAPLLPGEAPGDRKKKKMVVARLGDARRSLFGAVRRLRMRWVAAAYRRALRRLSAFYARALDDLLEGAASVSTIHAKAGADCSFATAFAPVVPVGGR